MVSSILPFKSFYYDAPMHHHQTQLSEHPSVSNMDPRRITISRNFSTSGDGKSLLHQTFDKKILERNAAAPLRTAVNMRNNFESLPAGLL